MNNKNAIVTGGARGIGLTIVKNLLLNKYNVTIVDNGDLNKSNFFEGKKIDHNKINFINCDITEKNSSRKIFESAEKKFGITDVLINNARYRSKFDLNEPEKYWKKSLDVMLSAPFLLSQKFINQSINGGVIINICSPAAFFATGESPSYHAAKGGLLSLTKYLSVIAGKKEIRVNAISPGLIIQDNSLDRYNSENNENYRKICETYQPMGKVGKEVDVANLINYLISDGSRYISGVCINLDGGATSQDQFYISQLINNLNK